MNTTIRTRIVKIGNSQGIRIPKLLLEQLKLGLDVELEVREDHLIIRPIHHPRTGWEEQFRAMAANGEDQLLDADSVGLSSWDEEEWEWQSDDSTST